MADADVRAAAFAYLEALALGKPASVHPAAVALGIASASDPLVDPETGSQAGKVLSVMVLEGGTAAVAQVRWENRGGWLTLLREGETWVVISAVTAPLTSAQTTPADMAAVVAACWEEYCGANRECDGERMAKIFHPLCRLTFTSGDGAVVIKTQVSDNI